jgi:uncharacterized protein YjbI with pentapeptide repeats
MANPEHLAMVKKGRAAWNRWRQKNLQNLLKPDLSRANLRKANLGRFNLSFANLSNSDLSEAMIWSADLHGANMSGGTLTNANFNGAFLVEANLTGANLIGAGLDITELRRVRLGGANLTRANLTNARLEGAELNESVLQEATVGYTVFSSCDLSTVRGLDTLIHKFPSTIGIDTIYLSEGKIPEIFLRGAGVPEDFITYAKSLVTNPIQFYSCFISYSTKDQAFADLLYADLQNKGVRCWFAPHDVQSGRKLHEQIDEAIRLHDKLLLILSPHSMESEWVKTEIAKARKREVRDKRRVLFPIRLAPFETLRDWECFDADTGKDSAREIREYFIPDFSNWKDHDSYQAAFQRLISDLKASDTKPK